MKTPRKTSITRKKKMPISKIRHLPPFAGCFLQITAMLCTVAAQQFASITSPQFFADSGFYGYSSLQNEKGELVMWGTRNQQLCLAKIDAAFQTTSVRYFPTTRRPSSTGGLAATSNGGYIATYQLNEGGGSFSGNAVRLDSEGQNVWGTILFSNSKQNTWNGHAMQLPDGNFITIGMLEDTVLVHKISSDGNVVWSNKMYYPKLSISGCRIVPCLTTHGSFIFTATQRNYEQYRQEDNIWRLIEMNFDGEVVTQQAHPTKDIAWAFRSITPVHNGGYFLSGNYLYSNGESYYLLVRLDAQLSVVWYKVFQTQPNTPPSSLTAYVLHDVREFDTTSIIAGGIDTDNGFNITIFLLNSNNGDRVWNKSLRTNFDLSPSIASLNFHKASDGYPVISYLTKIANQIYGYQIQKFGTKFPPRFTSDSSSMCRKISEKSIYIDSVSVSDTFPASRLSFQLINPSPATMTINESTGVLYWIPENSDTGLVSVTVVVFDQASQSDTLTYYLEITGTNNPPEFSTLKPDGTAYPGYSYTDSVKATDEDSPVLSYSLIQAPDGFTVENVSGKIHWIPKRNATGNHTVSVCANDGSLTDTLTFTIQVIDSVPVLKEKQPISCFFSDSCSCSWNYEDKALFTLQFGAPPCPDDTVTLLYNGFSVNPDFPDVIGFFFDLSYNNLPEGGTISFFHPMLTDNYTFAIKNKSA